METEEGRASSETVQPDAKPCRACCSPMPVAANKCTKCGGVQNWQRFLGASGTILSLVVALISILSFAVPIWITTFTPKVARPEAALVDVDDQGIATVVVSNHGTASVAIEDMLLGTGDAVLSFDFSGVSSGDRIVKAGEIRLYSMKLAVSNNEVRVGSLVTMFTSAKLCHLDLGVVTPDGKREQSRVDTSSWGDSEAQAKRPYPINLAKLITMTLTRISTDPAYAGTLCEIAAKRSNDPKHPGPACAAPPQQK
jgi:hypothetical protein